MADPSPALNTLVTFLKHQILLLDNVFVSAGAVLAYDYLLTIRREITFIWFSPWGYTKILYLFVRYLSIVGVSVELHNQLRVNIPPDTCHWSVPFVLWVLTAAIFGADAILAIRTWAVWRRNRKLGFALAFLLIGATTTSCVCNAIFIRALQYMSAPYPGFRGCTLARAGRTMLGDWIAETVLHIVVLTLMIISAFRSYKHGDMTRLSTAVYRDGILSYIYLLGCTIPNLICMVTLPGDIQLMLVPMLAAIYSVVTCRIVINIRASGSKGINGSATALHVDYHEESNSVEDPPLEFIVININRDPVFTDVP